MTTGSGWPAEGSSGRWEPFEPRDTAGEAGRFGRTECLGVLGLAIILCWV